MTYLQLYRYLGKLRASELAKTVQVRIDHQALVVAGVDRGDGDDPPLLVVESDD